MADKHMKRHSALLVVREVKNQTTINTTFPHQTGKHYREITSRVTTYLGNGLSYS